MSKSQFGPSGAKLWKAVTEGCEIDEPERVLLARACRTLDTIDQLTAVWEYEGIMRDTSQGAAVHPALRECRAQEMKLASLFRMLKLEFGDAEHQPIQRHRSLGVVG